MPDITQISLNGTVYDLRDKKWLDSISNCLTENPQDIKLELNNGTLTLKAGSKCYLKTDTTAPSVTIATDLTTTQTIDGVYFAIYNGTTLATILTTAYDYTSLPNTFSYPLALITVSGGAIVNINNVFNGFGYIGGTVFVLPGVKALCPNGRNADGTLKNLVDSVTSIRTFTGNISGATLDVLLQQEGLVTITNAFYYNEQDNTYRYIVDNNAYLRCKIATVITDSNAKIVSFMPKASFQAVDNSNSCVVVAEQFPTNENYYTWYRKYKNGMVEQGGVVTTSPSDLVRVNLPIAMRDNNYTVNITMRSAYNGAGTIGAQYGSDTTYILVGYRWNGVLDAGICSWYVCGMAAS